MTTKENLVTVKEDASREDILSLMHDNRIEKWNYKRQTYHVPMPPALLKKYIWILPKRH